MMLSRTPHASIHGNNATAGDIVPPTVPTPAILSPAGRWAAFVVLLIGGFLPPLDFFVVNVALPSVREALAASPAQEQLVISGYAGSYGPVRR
jgi:hypothetical protein